MTYKQRLEIVTSFSQLFDLRDELKSEIKQFESKKSSGFENIIACSEINFWIDRVEIRIKRLEALGHALDKIQTAPATVTGDKE